MDFPAETLLMSLPPNYPQERLLAVVKLTLTVIFFTLVLPFLMATPAQSTEEERGSGSVAAAETRCSRQQQQQSLPTTDEKVRQRQQHQLRESVVASQTSAQSDKNVVVDDNSNEQTTEYEISQSVIMYCTAICMLASLWVMLKSNPHNYYTTRGIFEAPLFTRAECNDILDMADRAAGVNYQNARSLKGMYETFRPGRAVDNNNDNDEELGLNKTMRGLLQEPFGWQKYRHGSYPTTDLNVVTDPFTKVDRNYIREKLDARLSPLISRIYGIPATALRANDMFVVRYDADKRAYLNNHTDDGDITFNVVLNDDFDGGGTRFWNRHKDEPFAWVRPRQVGQVLVSSALINHEGAAITEGTRTILVGFLSVDRVDPFDGQPTGLSWLASWGSLNWMTVKFKEGVRAAQTRLTVTKEESWTNHVVVRSLFADLLTILAGIGDVTMPHTKTSLFRSEDRQRYLEALDDAYNAVPEEKRRVGGRANGFSEWFGGQQINVDITGNVATYWATRLQNEHRFEVSEL